MIPLMANRPNKQPPEPQAQFQLRMPWKTKVRIMDIAEQRNDSMNNVILSALDVAYPEQ